MHQGIQEEHHYWIQERNREKNGGKTAGPAPKLDPNSKPITWEEFGFKDPWSYYHQFLPSKGWDKRAEG